MSSLFWVQRWRQAVRRMPASGRYSCNFFNLSVCRTRRLHRFPSASAQGLSHSALSSWPKGLSNGTACNSFNLLASASFLIPLCGSICLAKSSPSNRREPCRISRVSAGKAATCPEGTLDISRWCKPPVHHATLIQAPAGAAEIARLPFRRPCRGSSHIVCVTGGLHHRLISATPPASVIPV
jgi:hypothetical protein